MRLGSWNTADQIQHLRRLDAIELRAKLQCRQRIEKRVLVDFSVDGRERGVKEPKWNTRRSQDPLDHLVRGGEAVAQGGPALFRRALGDALAEQPRASVVLGQHGLEVTVEDEGAIEW